MAVDVRVKSKVKAVKLVQLVVEIKLLFFLLGIVGDSEAAVWLVVRY